MLTHRKDSTLGVSAATLNFKDTLVFIQHIAGLTDAALFASRGDFRAGLPTEGTGVRAGRETGGKAVGVVAVGGALQSYGVSGEGTRKQAVNIRLGRINNEVWGFSLLVQILNIC